MLLLDFPYPHTQGSNVHVLLWSSDRCLGFVIVIDIVVGAERGSYQQGTAKAACVGVPEHALALSVRH